MNEHRLKQIVTIFMSVLLSACAGQYRASAGNCDAGSLKADGQWQEIKAGDIPGNAVELFAKDWMVLAAGNEEKMNAMTISWGGLGQLWEMPVVTVYVSGSRYTHGFMEKYDHFTVSLFPNDKRKALLYIGSHSGRDGDKLKDAGLTPEFTNEGNPSFKEAVMTIECKKIYSHTFEKEKLPESVRSMYGDESRMKLHTMYIGQIERVWARK